MERRRLFVAAIADPGVKVTPVPATAPVAVPSPLDAKIMGPGREAGCEVLFACTARSEHVDRCNHRR